MNMQFIVEHRQPAEQGQLTFDLSGQRTNYNHKHLLESDQINLSPSNE